MDYHYFKMMSITKREVKSKTKEVITFLKVLATELKVYFMVLLKELLD